MNTTTSPGQNWRHPAVAGTLVILVAVVAFVLWAAMAPLNAAVVAMGFVKTENHRQGVQHPEGGIIKQLFVKDGDTVQAGQPLLELDNIGADANFRLLLETTAFEAIKRERLDAEQQFSPAFTHRPETLARYGDALARPAYQRELKIFQVRRNGLDQQLATLQDQTQAIELERQSLRTQIQANQDGMRLLAEELEMNRSLQTQQFVARTRVMAFERTMADYQTKLGEHQAAMAQAEQRLNDVKLRMASARSDYQRLASEEYKESSNRLAELRERMRPVEDALQRAQVLAPVSGKVVGLRFNALGQVAGPRDVLMEIVPDEEQLLVEAQVPVDGIKALYLEQAADLRFTAFKSRVTPLVSGKVSYVSADALVTDNGLPFYQVRIRPDAASLQAAGIAALQPGMAAEVYILTDARSALDYLLAPITDNMRKAMRER
jgi:HlyD family type I secretion membrane fusion protein